LFNINKQSALKTAKEGFAVVELFTSEGVPVALLLMRL
jgi:hypothetical protein